MICAVIFDMDGVLIDTEKHYNAAWCQAATEAGFPFTREHALLLRSCEAKEGEKLMQGIFGPSFDYCLSNYFLHYNPLLHTGFLPWVYHCFAASDSAV